MSALKRVFIPITKVDATQRLVYGVAAVEQPDKSGEVFDYTSSKPLIQAWSDEANKATGGASLGNIRAMHGKVAAGKVTELGFNDEDKQVEICGKIVDDAEWNKVEEGVYTGFSIGGSYTKRWQENGQPRYTAQIAEISIVDNPAMPGAHFTMFKGAGLEEQRTFVKYEETNVKITNAMVTARAQQLAKSAGSNGFADFIGQARAELEKEMGGEPYVATPEGGHGVTTLPGKAKITTAEGVENNHETPDGEHSEADGKMSNLPEQDAPGNTGGEMKTPSLGKSVPTNVDPRNAVKQGWQAIDGSFHLNKAAAIAHNESISGPAAQLDAALGALGKAVEVAKGFDPNDSKVINDEEKAKAGKKVAKTNSDGSETVEPKTIPALPATKAADGQPYGNVSYADPGHKADKKARYPVDTPKHIRAAWSYINMPKNHTGYTPSQVDAIKSKIVAAWKDKIGGEPPSVAEKAFSVLTLQKGMYTVSRLACLIEELDWLHQSCENEAEWEKDGSAVPAQLKGDIASLVGTLKNMLDEETSEMFDDDERAMLSDELEMAAKGIPGDQLLKFVDYLGSRSLSKSANSGRVHALLKAASMPKVHMDKIQEMHDHCASMGATCNDGNMGKAAGMDNTLNKAAFDELNTRNVELQGLLNKAVTAITAMAADVQLIKSQPAVLPPARLSVVEKGVDSRYSESGGAAMLGDERAADLLKSFGPDLLATAAIGLMHRTGGQKMDGVYGNNKS